MMQELENIKLSMDELGRMSVSEFKQSPKNQIIIILENIRSAYNVGSLFRTADAFLLEALYLCGYTAAPPHKEIKKTALGAEDTVSWIHFSTTSEAIKHAEQLGFTVFAAEQATASVLLHQSEEYFAAHQIEKVAVVFGNEVSGVEQSTILQCKHCIEIPQFGMKHSLNIATAAGVVAWELVKQHIKPHN